MYIGTAFSVCVLSQIKAVNCCFDIYVVSLRFRVLMLFLFLDASVWNSSKFMRISWNIVRSVVTCRLMRMRRKRKISQFLKFHGAALILRPPQLVEETLRPSRRQNSRTLSNRMASTRGLVALHRQRIWRALRRQMDHTQTRCLTGLRNNPIYCRYLA